MSGEDWLERTPYLTIEIIPEGTLPLLQAKMRKGEDSPVLL